MPAELARALARRLGDNDESDTDSDESEAAVANAEPSRASHADPIRRARIFLRRLFTDPVTGIVTDCDPRRRRFDGVLAKLLIYRDQHCRDPFCDAPIRHLDHIHTHASRGPTSASNGRGMCERGNYVRHMPGFTIRLVDPTRHIVETTTPTGHTYRSHPPPAPGSRRAAAAYFRSAPTRARPDSSRATGTRNGEHDT